MTLPAELSTWRDLPALQQPEWPDVDAVAAARAKLAGLPPLVFAGEARRLRSQLAKAARGEAFLLQAGDCAESFHELSAPIIRNKLKIILQMALVLTYGSGLPVVKVGRIAGQFAKPRSSSTETIDGVTLPAFRGHIINDDAFTTEARVPDPQRMVDAYHHAASTLNLLRAFTTGGFADLSQVHNWNLEFVAESPQGQAYERIASDIDRALRFMKAIGLDTPSGATLQQDATLRQVDFFTSHESLLLDYEDPLTRRDSTTGEWYACSAHFLWLGERTRQLENAHVNFLRSVNNPVGCKVGPTMTPHELLEVCETLNPQRIPGRLSLITRMGAGKIDDALPPLLAAVRDAGHPVVWVCDPMHGNTRTSASGHKTRDFNDIFSEVVSFFRAHQDQNTWPGGLHVELTGDDVTECTGGSAPVEEHELSSRYETICDPRLNARQSTDLAFHVAELLQQIVRP
jgi:3-deoxy-7-phosphoheptulonate synthase